MTKLIVAFSNFVKAPKNNKRNRPGAYASLTLLPTSLFSYVFLNYATVVSVADPMSNVS